GAHLNTASNTRLALVRSAELQFAESRSAGFPTCCVAVLPAWGRREFKPALRPWPRRRLEIGDTAGCETCATISPCAATARWATLSTALDQRAHLNTAPNTRLALVRSADLQSAESPRVSGCFQRRMRFRSMFIGLRET